MALFNSFQFGDVDSKDYGVYISGDSVYDSPARSVDLVQVPGRNGALALDNGYYENIEVTYPAGSFGTSQEEWREKMLAIRNALAAQRGYQRLIDTYHPEHYRLGMFFAGISASPVQYNRAGQFPIRFNCKPQRFLISGDEAVEFTAEGQEEVYGPSSIASFEAEEGAEIRELTVDLEPVQDLNGYDNPWPAGGGKNKFNSATATGSFFSRSGDTFTNTETDTRTSLQLQFQAYNDDTLVTYIPSTAFTGTYPERVRGSITISEPVTRFRLKHNGLSRDLALNIPWTAQGTFEVSFLIPKSDPTTVGGLVIEDIMITTDGSYTPYAPYSNICPISGHTEVNLYRTGKNIASGYESGAIETNGTHTANVHRVRTPDYIKVVEGETYTFSATANKTLQGLVYLYTDNLNSERVNTSAAWSSLPITFTIPTGAHYATVVIRYSDNGVINTSAITAFQLEKGSIATSYEPYTGQTYNVPLGQTVYGGTLDVTTGVLTVDRAMVTLNGSESWSAHGSIASWYYLDSVLDASYVNAISKSFAISNKYVQNYYSQAAAFENGQFGIGLPTGASHNRLVVKDTAYTTVAQFKSALETSPLQVCYTLATSLTYQLTPSAVSALLGQNNIWSDSGEVEVEVASPVDLTNPTNFPAKPLIRVYGNGSVQVGDTIATVQNNADGYVDIDCESMNCYDTTGGRNADVSFSGNNFPELASGDNGILLTGPSRVEITPRWWEL